MKNTNNSPITRRSKSADPNVLSSQLADRATEQGDLTQLNTTDKTSLVNALREVKTQAINNTTSISNNTTALTNIGNASPKGTYATLSALQTAFSTGTTGIYVVTADGNWYYWSGSAWTVGGVYQSTGIADGSITSNKLADTAGDGLVGSTNLIDLTKATLGYYLGDSGNQVLLSNAGYSDFIQVNKGQTYSLYGIFNNTYAVNAYDVNKNFIATIYTTQITGAYHNWIYTAGQTKDANNNIIDSNVVYVRVNFDTGSNLKEMFVKGTTYPATYTPYNNDFFSANLKNAVLSKLPTKTSQLTNDNGFIGTIDVALPTFGDNLVASTNLIDTTKATLGYYLGDNGAQVVLSNGAYSDFISVTKGQSYSFYGIFNNIFGLTVYDSNKTYLKTIYTTWLAGAYHNWNYTAGSTSDGNNIIDSNVAYVRVNFDATSDIKKMFVKGLTYPATYTPYKLDFLSTKLKNTVSSKVTTISCWGDSKTQGNQDGTGVTYPSVLQNLLTSNGYSYTVNNMGVGGEYTTGIAGRQGGMPLYVQPFTIPAGTTPIQVATNISQNNIAKAGYAGLNPCYINGIQGNLGYDSTNNYNTFTRITAGTTVSVTRPAQIVTDGMVNHRNDILIIDIGQNGGFGSIDEWIKQIWCMVNYSQCKEFIVLGRNIENSNPAFYNATIEPQFQMAFGNRYINLRAYDVAYGLADAGLNATSADNTAISNSQVPPSLLFDTVHENQYGYTIKGQQVFNKLQELQIISK